jgi:iron complex transport system ATP-binding protein
MVMVGIKGLSVRLGRRQVLEGVTATLAPGNLVGIIGPNGAGKSTLVRAMLGLTAHSAGSVTIDGQDMAALPPREMARRIAYLPQGQVLHWPLSVERLVALGRLPHLAPLSRIGEEDRAIVSAAMERADVAHLRHRNAIELSGGERARVLLARALAVGAAGLIADEPLASLDPGHQIDVMTLLKREARDGRLVVAVLHDLTMAARYCDRLILIDRGRLIADGTPAHVLTPQLLADVYGIVARVETDGASSTVIPLDRVARPGDPS